MQTFSMEIMMPKFNKQDLRIELASVIAVMARQIELWSNNTDTVGAFLGSSNVNNTFDLTPEDIDLSHFPGAQSVLEAYDYAFAPSGDQSPDMDSLQELQDLIAGLPREDFGGDFRAFPNYLNGDGLIADVRSAVWARAALDGIDDGMTPDLSTRQLALLADMTEGAVRNAMTQTGEAGLTALHKSKPARFDVDEARRWLSGRRGFVPTPKGPADDPILNERLRGFDRMEQLTDFIERHTRRLHGGISELATALSWAEDDAAAWRNGTYQFDEDQAQMLGQALGADMPTFVGKTLELARRRDSEKGVSE